MSQLTRYFVAFAVAMQCCCAFPISALLVGSACTDACDAATPDDDPQESTYSVFCGTDGTTYNTTIDKFNNNDCYSRCGVAARYIGLCGCPNHCGSHVAHGECAKVNETSSEIHCECMPGFSGDDCMKVDCATGNGCSGHGTCTPASTASIVGGDYCSCVAGYTGAYCGQEVFQYPLYEPVIANVPPLLQPGYEYVTPLLNMSVIGDLRVRIAQEDFDYLVDPFTVYNDSKVDKPATVFYHNGNYLVDNISAMMAVKGATSRLDFKKGWKISFPNKVDQAKFFGLRKIGLKTGNDGDDSCLKPFIMSSLGRMLGIMLPRPAMTTLYVNDVFMGLYYFDEAVDDNSFLEATFGASDGPIVKLTYISYLRYLGQNVSVYQDQGKVELGGGILHFIDTKDWELYIDFVYNASLPTMVPSDLIDVDAMLRMAVMEAFVLDDDHFIGGNNYFLYRPYPNKPWVLIDHDFDSEFAANKVPADPLQYPFDSHLNGGNPLVVAAFRDPVYFQRYRAVIDQLVRSPILADGIPVDGSLGDSEEPLASVYRRLAAFTVPWVGVDLMQQFAFATTVDSFNEGASSTSNLLPARATIIRDSYLAPVSDDGGNLSGGEIGGIVAGGVVLVAILAFILFRLKSAKRHADRYEAVTEPQNQYLP